MLGELRPRTEQYRSEYSRSKCSFRVVRRNVFEPSLMLKYGEVFFPEYLAHLVPNAVSTQGSVV